MKKRASLLLVVAALALFGCGDDDGGTVTSEGSGSGSGSGSASASGSGSGSASGSASGSSAAAGCEVVGGTDEAGTTEVHAVLDEWTIEVDTDTVEAGAITFEADNVGADDHELVIVKGATPSELTITEDGLDESALPEGAEVLGELEGFPGGESCTGTFALDAGDYSLVCNIVEASEDEAHAHEGMVTGFTVT